MKVYPTHVTHTIRERTFIPRKKVSLQLVFHSRLRMQPKRESHQTTQPVEKGLVELTNERMSFPAQKNLEEGEASENDER